MFEKKRGKRFLASVMALVMLLSLAPVGALAAGEEPPTNEECSAMPLPANEDNPKPVVTDEENTANTNEELTPPPPNEDYAETPADNNDASTAVSEMPVIMNPVDLLNQASDYTTELTWSQPSSSIKDATFFYLKTPTSKLNSNKAEDWGPALGNGEINTDGLKWKKSDVWGTNGRVENATNVTNSNVNSWPSNHGKYDSEKGGYVLSEGSTHWETIFNAYEDSIKKQLNGESPQKSDVEAIILTPFKVSKNNVTTGKTEKSYHVDCKVEVKCYTFATATFKLWDDEAKEYQDHSADNYRVGSLVTFPKMPDKSGYTFSGWYLDEGRTQPVGDSYTIKDNVDFYAKYEKKQPKTYTLTINYVYEDGTKAADTHTEQLKKDAKYDVSSPEITGYVADKSKVSGTMPAEDTEVTVTYTKKEPVVSQLTYFIKLHLINGSGNDSTTNIVENQQAYAGKKLNDLITADVTAKVNELKGDKNYVPGATKVNNSTPLTGDATLTANGTTIDLYYYLDNWKDADNTTDKDSETGGDDIPDCYQVLVKYQSGDTNRGSVGPLTMEVLTIKSNGVYASEGQVTATGSTAEATGRNYFSNWTNKDNTQVGSKATLEAQTIKNAKGGDVYTFTANFDRSSGGGSGGSNRPKPPVVEIPDDVPTGLNGKDHYAYIIGYGNNDVRPQNNITRAEVATIFFRLLTDETREANMTKSNGYNDVKDGDWFCCAVSTLSKMGIIKGYEDGSFKPNAPISRAEFAAIAARFDPDGDKTPASFSDVTSHWAKDEISIAANHGWIKGYEDGSFKPDQKITRAETMTLVNRVLNRLPEAKDDLHKDMKTWVDNMDETAWYYLAVQEATNSHYFKNKTSTKFEQWTDLRDTRDWSELEK